MVVVNNGPYISDRIKLGQEFTQDKLVTIIGILQTTML